MTWPYKEGSLVRFNPRNARSLKRFKAMTPPREHQTLYSRVEAGNRMLDCGGAAKTGAYALVKNPEKTADGWNIFLPVLFDGTVMRRDYMDFWELVEEPDDA